MKKFLVIFLDANKKQIAEGMVECDSPNALKAAVAEGKKNFPEAVACVALPLNDEEAAALQGVLEADPACIIHETEGFAKANAPAPSNVVPMSQRLH